MKGINNLPFLRHDVVSVASIVWGGGCRCQSTSSVFEITRLTIGISMQIK